MELEYSLVVYFLSVYACFLKISFLSNCSSIRLQSTHLGYLSIKVVLADLRTTVTLKINITIKNPINKNWQYLLYNVSFLFAKFSQTISEGSLDSDNSITCPNSLKFYYSVSSPKNLLHQFSSLEKFFMHLSLAS